MTSTVPIGVGRQFHRLLLVTATSGKRGLHNLQYEPRTQWHYHLRMCWFWVFNLLPVTVLLLGVLLDKDHAILWSAIMLSFNTYLSLYANFATDFDGVHSSYAAMKGVEISVKQDIQMGQTDA